MIWSHLVMAPCHEGNDRKALNCVFLHRTLTWIEAAGEVHCLQIVVTTLLVFFQRTALLIAPTTISTFVGLANYKVKMEFTEWTKLNIGQQNPESTKHMPTEHLKIGSFHITLTAVLTDRRKSGQQIRRTRNGFWYILSSRLKACVQIKINVGIQLNLYDSLNCLEAVIVHFLYMVCDFPLLEPNHEQRCLCYYATSLELEFLS